MIVIEIFMKDALSERWVRWDVAETVAAAEYKMRELALELPGQKFRIRP